MFHAASAAFCPTAPGLRLARGSVVDGRGRSAGGTGSGRCCGVALAGACGAGAAGGGCWALTTVNDTAAMAIPAANLVSLMSSSLYSRTTHTESRKHGITEAI